jgi:hypothetical protein
MVLQKWVHMIHSNNSNYGASEMGSYDTFEKQQLEGSLLHDKKTSKIYP